MEYIITREQADLDENGVRKPGRVYVTGPHFGGDIYSSTHNPEQASRFSKDDAEQLVLQKWHGLRPSTEPASVLTPKSA